MRLLCALVLALCPTLLGIGKAGALKRRPGQLADMTTALELMKSEIGLHRTSMTELPTVMLTAVSGIPRELFTGLNALIPLMDTVGFVEIWRRAVSVLPLREPEREALSRLGATLGRFDAQTQCRELDICISRFVAFEREAAEECRKNAGLYAGLGLSLGLILAILTI